jgi:hypothetical protein
MTKSHSFLFSKLYWQIGKASRNQSDSILVRHTARAQMAGRMGRSGLSSMPQFAGHMTAGIVKALHFSHLWLKTLGFGAHRFSMLESSMSRMPQGYLNGYYREVTVQVGAEEDFGPIDITNVRAALAVWKSIIMFKNQSGMQNTRIRRKRSVESGAFAQALTAFL